MSEWISVKDRLPRNGEKVLALINGVDRYDVTYCDHAEIATFWADEADKEWLAENIYNVDGFCLKVDVHYWMPIPSIPEEPKETMDEEKMTIKLPKPGKLYRHFKGRLYKVITIAEHTETGEDMVIYEEEGGSGTYARPLSEWIKPVQTDRFVEVDDV